MNRGDGISAVNLLQCNLGGGVHLFGSELGLPRISDSAIVKQPAWAAAINSSGSVPGMPSKRLANP